MWQTKTGRGWDQTIRWDNFDKLLSLTGVSVTVMPVMNEDNGDNDGPAKSSLITDQMIADISPTSDPAIAQSVIESGWANDNTLPVTVIVTILLQSTAPGSPSHQLIIRFG